MFNWLKKPKNASMAIQGGLMLGVLMLVAPFAFMLLQATLALLVVGLLGMGVIFFGPAVGDWFAAMRLKSIKAVAKANPIETLENYMIQSRETIRQWKVGLQEYDAAIAHFIGVAKDLISKYPEKTEEYVRQVASRQALRAKRVEAIKAAEQDLKIKAGQLEQLKAEYRMAQVANEMDRKAALLNDGEKFDPTRIEAAIQQIDTDVHKSMASGGAIFQDLDFDPNRALALDDESFLQAQQSLGIPLKHIERVSS